MNTDENDFSDDDGLLFELDGDDTGFDGIFEEQYDGNALRHYLRSAADQYLVMVESLKRTLAEELKRILAPQQQIYKKKSTSVGTK
jgi:hypothetical protein